MRATIANANLDAKDDKFLNPDVEGGNQCQSPHNLFFKLQQHFIHVCFVNCQTIQCLIRAFRGCTGSLHLDKYDTIQENRSVLVVYFLHWLARSLVVSVTYLSAAKAGRSPSSDAKIKATARLQFIE